MKFLIKKNHSCVVQLMLYYQIIWRTV